MFHTAFRLKRLAAANVLAAGIALAISSIGIVRAEHAMPDGSVSYACSGGTACVEGNSTGSKTWGVYGISSTADGVHGVTNATNGNSGTSGISTGTTGSAHGVYGRSSNGQGVYGSSTASGSAGVEGIQTSGPNPGWGVWAESADTTGIDAALFAQADKPATSIFYGQNTANKVEGIPDRCIIDAVANLSCTGTISGGLDMRVRHTDAMGRQVDAFGSQSTSATLEDFGTGQLSGGVARVTLDRSFAATIDRGAAYHVFLTPLGDSRGLYVSLKTPSGFEVRESQGGRSTLAFDYRIVAHPADAQNGRLPLAAPPRPVPRLPASGP